MKDAMLDSIWVAHHQRFSADFGGAMDRLGERIAVAEGDSLPLVARAMSLVLAVSLASLSVGAAIA